MRLQARDDRIQRARLCAIDLVEPLGDDLATAFLQVVAERSRIQLAARKAFLPRKPFGGLEKIVRYRDGSLHVHEYNCGYTRQQARPPSQKCL